MQLHPELNPKPTGLVGFSFNGLGQVLSLEAPLTPILQRTSPVRCSLLYLNGSRYTRFLESPLGSHHLVLHGSEGYADFDGH